MLRFDQARIDKYEITDEGFLVADAIVTRTGIFKYLNADGSTRNELRHPDDVLDVESLDTMSMLPMTLLHPKQKVVNSDNSKELTVGFTGQSVEVLEDKDEHLIKTRVKVTDKKAITSIQNGMREMSLGYNVLLIPESGDFNGQKYDARQTNMKYNHLSIVPKARAGSKSRIILDADDAVQHTDDQTSHKHKKSKEDNRMLVKRKLNGIEYECSPELDNHIDALEKKAETVKSEVKTANDSVSSIQGKLDSATEELEELKKLNNDDVVQAAVDARLALVAEAAPHLDADTTKKLPGMTENEIKSAVIITRFPKAGEKLDGAEQSYIDARYDAALELPEKKEDSVAHQRKQMFKKKANTDSSGGTERTVNDARAEYMKNLEGNWATKANKE